jgi:hypothetical protein
MLATGGRLTLRLTANWMLFRDAERQLLETLIDAFDQYEKAHANLPTDGRQALPSLGAECVPERTQADRANNLGDDGAGSRTRQAAMEVQGMPSGVSKGMGNTALPRREDCE